MHAEMAVRQDEMFPNASGSTAGLYCCGEFFHWKDLGAFAIGREWKWLCPTCREVLRVDQLVLPSDLPCDLRALFVEHGYVS